MPPVQRADPYPAYNFKLIVNGISDDGAAVSGSFKEISGLNADIKPIEYRAGSEDTTVRKVPGLRTHTNLMCKRGATGHTQFWDWIKRAVDGQVQRAEGAVVLHDENQNEVMRWNFARGWPCKYTAPTFNAATNEIGMEMIEICVEELSLDA